MCEAQSLGTVRESKVPAELEVNRFGRSLTLPNVTSVEVRWHGGEVLSGNLATMSESEVSLESRVFAEPIELDRSALDSIRFLLPAQPALKVAARYELVLKDGSQLHTDVEKIGDGLVWLNDPKFGRVRIPLEQCQSLRELGDVQYEWAGDMGEWQLSGH